MLRDIFDIFPSYPFMACPAQAARLASLKLRGGMLGFSSLPGGSGHLEPAYHHALTHVGQMERNCATHEDTRMHLDLYIGICVYKYIDIKTYTSHTYAMYAFTLPFASRGPSTS